MRKCRLDNFNGHFVEFQLNNNDGKLDQISFDSHGMQFFISHYRFYLVDFYYTTVQPFTVSIYRAGLGNNENAELPWLME